MIHKTLVVLHRWTALLATLLILLVAITGSILVFEGAIDRALHPELWHVTPGPRRASLDSMIAHASAAVPGPPPATISLAARDDQAALVQVGPNQVFVDPYTAAVRGHRTVAEWNETFPRRVHVLHVSLMTGSVGGEIVGAITCASLFLVLTGVIIWWRDKLWRVRWSASWKRIVFDLHHSLGVIAALVIATITVSGMFIHYKTLDRWMAGLDSSPPPRAAVQSTGAPGARAMSFDAAYDRATRALPGARVMFVSVPPDSDQPIVAGMRFPEDHTPAGRSRVFLDRFTGTVLLAGSTRQAQLGTRLKNEIRSIHTGDLYGKPTEMLWLAAALILATQGITGLTMWWNGRAARAAISARRQ